MKPRKVWIRPGAKKAVKALRRGRGAEREEFFANGGTAIVWKGGPTHTFVNRKAESQRKACRDRKDID